MLFASYDPTASNCGPASNLTMPCALDGAAVINVSSFMINDTTGNFSNDGGIAIVAPEPGTMLLFGTLLLGFAIRRSP